MVHRPRIYCPLCQGCPGEMQPAHFILEEAIADDGEEEEEEGLGELVRRDYMDLPAIPDEAREEEITVHTYCWAIVKRIFQRERYDQLWIEQFTKCLDYLTPHIITRVPFAQEADQLDYDIFATLKPALYNNSTTAENRNAVVLPLPVELILKIYDLLETEEDIVNLSDVLPIGPNPEIWKKLGEKYMLAPDLDPRANVSTLVRNVQSRLADRYPRTTNYRVIWKNMELLKARMDSPPIVNALSDEEMGEGLRAPEGSRIKLPRGQDVILTVCFTNSMRTFESIICGIGFNGRVIGSAGSKSETAVFTGLQGFGASFTHSPRRCIGIRVDDQKGARSFEGNDRREGDCVQRCDSQTMEWEDGGEILVKFQHHHDIFDGQPQAIIDLGYRDPTGVDHWFADACESANHGHSEFPTYRYIRRLRRSVLVSEN